MDISAHQSMLEEEVHKVVDALSEIFNEIGLDRRERESRQDTVFQALTSALHQQLTSVNQEKNSIVEECQKWAKEIQQMQRSLGDREDNLKITPPLLSCLDCFKQKHQQVSKTYSDRYDSIKKLVHALNTYASHMEDSVVRIRLPPITDDISQVSTYDISRNYYDQLEEEFDNVYKEYTRRSATVAQLAREITTLWVDLGTPNSQIDRAIVEHGNQTAITLSLAKDDMERLRIKKTRLVEEKNQRVQNMEAMKNEISELWVKLGMEESERRKFLARHSGIDLNCARNLEHELDKMHQIKRENIHVFVNDARHQIQTLWDQLYMSAEERNYFQAIYSENFNDDLLETHEMEIQRLNALIEQRAPILNLISKHRELMNDKEQLAISATDVTRLMGRGGPGGRDPTRLLREEKMRKRLAKELPRVEVELKKSLEDWDEEHDAPFLVDGEDYLDILIRTSTVAASRSRTPGPGANPTRGRSNTTGAMTPMSGSFSSARSKSRPAEKPQAPPLRAKTPTMRSKTPVGRPKTPAGNSLAHSQSLNSTIGRSTGRGLQSAQSSYSNASYTSNYSNASSGASSTVDRTGSLRTPGTFGGRIPQLGSTKTPTRLARPALQPFQSGQTSPQRHDPPLTAPLTGSMTLGRSNAHLVKRKNAINNVPKMQQLFQIDQDTRLSQDKRLSQDSRHSQDGSLHRLRESDGPPSRPHSVHTIVPRLSQRSVRSVSPAESANYETYPATDEEEEDHRDSPKGNGYPRPPAGYQDSQRTFSVSTITSEIPTSGSENWETYGDESEAESEADPRATYYRQKQQQSTPRSGFTGFGHPKSIGLVRESVSGSDEWMSEVSNY